MNIDGIFSDTETVNKFIKKKCGKQLGSGVFRDVYELKDYPKLVAKIEKLPTKEQGYATFANATEWRNYINSMYWPAIANWLAPCEGISDNGVILIQWKVEHKNFDRYPTHIPNVFTDTKYSNFGWIGKKFVCCDYSFFVQTSFRMKKTKWWGMEDLNLTGQ